MNEVATMLPSQHDLEVATKLGDELTAVTKHSHCILVALFGGTTGLHHRPDHDPIVASSDIDVLIADLRTRVARGDCGGDF